MKPIIAEKLFSNIKSNEKDLPVVLQYLQKTEIPKRLEREDFFVRSFEHQTNRHVFRRLLHKPLI